MIKKLGNFVGCLDFSSNKVVNMIILAAAKAGNPHETSL